MIKDRIELRLKETQEYFLEKCQASAEKMFREGHIIVNKQLDETRTRLDQIDASNNAINSKFAALFESNEEAMKMHDEIKRIFNEESQTFFAERLKWKSDAQQEIEQ